MFLFFNNLSVILNYSQKGVLSKIVNRAVHLNAIEWQLQMIAHTAFFLANVNKPWEKYIFAGQFLELVIHALFDSLKWLVSELPKELQKL